MQADFIFDNGIDIFMNFSYQPKAPLFFGYTFNCPFVDFGISKSFFNDNLNVLLDINPFNLNFRDEYFFYNSKMISKTKEYYTNIYFEITYNFLRGKLKTSNRTDKTEKDF
jgi:hypothetical protein